MFRKAHQEGNSFDVVITDLGMPHIDGRQVATGDQGDGSRYPCDSADRLGPATIRRWRPAGAMSIVS
jgi:hypothetical protein